MFSVQILTFGDHEPLARRCLESIIASADWSLIDDVRIGCNAVHQATVEYLQYAMLRVEAPCWLVHERSGRNVGKYPLMRRMLYDPQQTVTSRYVMWFDDDSYLRTPSRAWWSKAAEQAQASVMVGKRYRVGFSTAQRTATQQQPWYTGKPWEPVPRPVTFLQGGWWIAQTSFLAKWDYPFPELYHNGGDVILGELCRQQDAIVTDTNAGVAINADADGNESKSLRRGLTTKPLWHDYVAGRTPDLSHHNFQHRYSPGNRLGLQNSQDRSGPES